MFEKIDIQCFFLNENLSKRVLDCFSGTSFLLLFLLLFLLFGTSVVTKTSVTDMGHNIRRSSK